jgi:hypothetical protein
MKQIRSRKKNAVIPQIRGKCHAAEILIKQDIIPVDPEMRHILNQFIGSILFREIQRPDRFRENVRDILCPGIYKSRLE